jgi:hypothetical protein
MSKSYFYNKFRMHGLSPVEQSDVFNMADINRDGQLSQTEWTAFHQFFITPFQNCRTPDFLLDVAQIKDCVLGQEWFSKLAYQGKLQKTFEGLGVHEGGEASDSSGDAVAADLILACDRNLDGKLNFSEYLFLRRAAVAWTMCASERMNRAGLKCGLSIVVQSRTVSQSEADVAFRVALGYMKGSWDISFVAFAMISDLYRTFSSFDVPLDNGFISEDDMVHKLSEQDMPHRITRDSIRSIYKATGEKQLQFPMFVNAVIIYNRWLTYTEAMNSVTMDLDTFFAILHDRLIPFYIRKIVDAIPVNIPTDSIVA